MNRLHFHMVQVDELKSEEEKKNRWSLNIAVEIERLPRVVYKDDIDNWRRGSNCRSIESPPRRLIVIRCEGIYKKRGTQGAEKEKLVDGSSVHFPTAGRFKFPTLFFTSSSVSDNVRLIQHLYIYIYNPIEIIGFYARKKEKETKEWRRAEDGERENDRAHFLITLPPHHGAPRISSFLLRVLFHVFDVTCATTRGDIYIYTKRDALHHFQKVQPSALSSSIPLLLLFPVPFSRFLMKHRYIYLACLSLSLIASSLSLFFSFFFPIRH